MEAAGMPWMKFQLPGFAFLTLALERSQLVGNAGFYGSFRICIFTRGKTLTRVLRYLIIFESYALDK